MRSLKYTGLAVLTVVALLSVFSVAAQKRKEAGAKALFYDPVTGATLKPSEKQKDPQTGMVKVKQAQGDMVRYVGIHYWIELEGVGPVTADRTFYTGDRIRLHVRSNVDGYLSLWTLDPSGRGELLFPSSGHKEGENFVKADTDWVTPGYIVFKPPIQDERLLVFFSRSPKDIPAPTGTATDAQAVARAVPEGEKALAFETEKKTPEEVGTYVVNKKGGPVASEIRLAHRPRSAGQ